ncbi:hypothetical protein AHIS1_p062 [Acaryochloris phage A-HIS1]|nr:hypothetical protein AHIS1_p062 [Acaryochloris phage A-HIS1]
MITFKATVYGIEKTFTGKLIASHEGRIIVNLYGDQYRFSKHEIEIVG